MVGVGTVKDIVDACAYANVFHAFIAAEQVQRVPTRCLVGILAAVREDVILYAVLAAISTHHAADVPVGARVFQANGAAQWWHLGDGAIVVGVLCMDIGQRGAAGPVTAPADTSLYLETVKLCIDIAVDAGIVVLQDAFLVMGAVAQDIVADVVVVDRCGGIPEPGVPGIAQLQLVMRFRVQVWVADPVLAGIRPVVAGDEAFCGIGGAYAAAQGGIDGAIGWSSPSPVP
jgi:hypothetical protein